MTTLEEHERIYYENLLVKSWNELPQCRLVVQNVSPMANERLWGRVLPRRGMNREEYGLDNDPLATHWRWMDVVKSRELKDTGESVKENLLYRHYNSLIRFKYEYVRGELELVSLERRRTIFGKFSRIGHVSFLLEGFSMLLIRQRVKGRREFFIENVVKPLGELGVKVTEGHWQLDHLDEEEA